MTRTCGFQRRIHGQPPRVHHVRLLMLGEAHEPIFCRLRCPGCCQWALQNQPLMGASKPATSFRGSRSHSHSTHLRFPVQSIRNRLGFLFSPEARASRRHNIPADDRSPGANRTPIASSLPSSGPSEPGGALAGFEPPGASGAIRSTLETTTVLTVPVKMEVCKEPDHVGLGHLAHGVAGQPLQGEQPGGQLVRASRSPAQRRSSSSVSASPGASTTAAPIRSPHSGSGRPTTATSRTAGCSPIASSTSRAETFTRWRTRVHLLANRTPSRTRLPFCAGSGLRELLLFFCHSLFYHQPRLIIHDFTQMLIS